MPQSRSPPTGPISPTYACVIKISLEHESPRPEEVPDVVELTTRQMRLRARVFCVADPTARRPVSLVPMHASRIWQHLRFYRRGIGMPFPDPDCKHWLDGPSPHLPCARARSDLAAVLEGLPDQHDLVLSNLGKERR